MIDNWLINALFRIEGYVALDRNPGQGYHTLLFRMIQGDLLSACPHRRFHTLIISLLGLLDSRAALSNSYPNACMPMQGGSLYHFCDGFWYDPAGPRTYDLLCERQDTLTTEPTRHGFNFHSLLFSSICKNADI